MGVSFFFIKRCALQDQQLYYNFDTGAHLYVVEDYPTDHELWTRYPCPKGFVPDPDITTVAVVTAPQEHPTLFLANISVKPESPVPSWLVSFFVGWIMPEVVRRMFKSSMKCLSDIGPQYRHVKEDKLGVYAQSARLVEAAKASNKSRDAETYTLKRMPSPEVLAKRARSLLEFDKEPEECEYSGRTHTWL